MDDNSVCFLFLLTFGVVSNFSHSNVYLMCPEWYFFVVLLCISLMIRQWARFHVLTGHSDVASIYGWPCIFVRYPNFLPIFFFFQLGCVCCSLGYSWVGHNILQENSNFFTNPIVFITELYFFFLIVSGYVIRCILWIYSSRIYSQSVDFCFLYGVMGSSQSCLLTIFVRLDLIESTGEIIWASSLLKG